MKRILLFTFVCTLAAYMYAENYTYEGVVKDQDGNVIPNATVKAIASNNNVIQETVADNSGRWQINIDNQNVLYLVFSAIGHTAHRISDPIPDNGERLVTLHNRIYYKAGKRSTIILPTAPNATAGRYYRVDHRDETHVYFEREYTPQANVPYVFFPYEDMEIDLDRFAQSDGTIAMGQKSVTVGPKTTEWEDNVVFNGSYHTGESDVIVINCGEVETFEESPVENWTHWNHMLPMHVGLYYTCSHFYQGNMLEGTAIPVKPELVFHDTELPYRPFIEEGKVWKVGWFPAAINIAQKLDYYYFEGDSVIDGRNCKKMMCRHESNEYWGSTVPWTEYVGSIYEEYRRVFCVFSGKHDFELLYDFASEIGDTIDVYGGVAAYRDPTVSCIILKREQGNNAFFKGNVTYVAARQPQWNNEQQAKIYEYDYEYPCLWMEGIGATTPVSNMTYANWAGDYDGLISCYINDDVLYMNTYLVDGVTPDEGDYTDGDVKKHWLDFTHTTKPRPKAPRKAENGESQMTNDESSADDVRLSGEYSDTKLYVSLSPLQGPYTITITDADNNSVYTHTVQTSSVVAINTDLSQYANGTYTICVENAEEAYTAQLVKGLDVAVRDIPAINGKSVNGESVNGKSVNGKSVNGKWYDLSGRRLSRRPSQGLYIENGQLRVAMKHTSR